MKRAQNKLLVSGILILFAIILTLFFLIKYLKTAVWASNKNAFQKVEQVFNPSNIIPDTTKRSINEFAHPYLVMPDSFRNSGNNDSAVYYYQKAAEKFLKESNWQGYIMSLNQAGTGYNKIGAYDSVLVRLNDALKVGLQKLRETHPLVADTYFYLGQYYDLNNDPEKAIANHQKSLNLRLKLFGSNNIYVADSYKGLGDVCLYVLRDYQNAEEYYKKVLNIREALLESTDVDLLRTYYTLASINRQKGDYRNALLYANKALNISETLSENEVYFLSLCLHILANIHNEIKNYDTAIKYYQQAIQLIRKNEGEDSYVLADYYNNIGTIYLIKHDYSKADYYLKKGLHINLLNFSPDSYETSKSYHNLGWFFTENNNYDSALFYYKKCLEARIQNSGKNTADVADVYEDLGKMFEHFDSLKVALKHYQKALHGLVKGFDNEDIYLNPYISPNNYRPELFDIIINKAHAFRKLYILHPDNIKYLKTAFALYCLGDVLNDLSRNSYSQEDSKLFLEGYHEADFEQGLKVAFMLYDLTKEKRYLEQAYKFIEKSKYILLFESLAKAEGFNKAGIPNDLKEQENKLKVEKSYYHQEIEREEQNEIHNIKRIKNLQQKEFEVSRKQGKLKERLIKEFPNYYQIKYDSLAIDLAGIQRSLKNTNTKIIEFYWGVSTVYSVIIDKDDVNLISIGNKKRIEILIDNYLKILSSNSDFTSHNFQGFKENALELYQILLAPILEGKLDNKVSASVEELIIIPDGPLAFLPFEALITDLTPSSTIDYKNLNYLVRNYKISYAYSSNLLLKNKSSRKNKDAQNLIAFGFSNDIKNTGNYKKDNDNQELQGSTRELKAIASVIKGEYYAGEQATEENFKRDAPEYDILHLAVHGISDIKNEFNTSLIFKKGKNSKEDGILYPYELYTLNLKSQLVVLSACETGVGRQFKGEGIYSMARGFAYAGCPSIVMSFWKVNDRATADLMSHFYQMLSSGIRIDEAMRQAKLAYLNEADEYSAHPANWAAFVPLGDMSPIHSQNQNIHWIIWGGALIVIISLVLIAKAKYFTKTKA